MEKEKNYQLLNHCVSVFITLGIIALGIFVFPNAICRLLESFRDFFISVVRLFDDTVPATVIKLPSWQITESKYYSTRLLPFTWDEFKTGFWSYWREFIRVSNLLEYLVWLYNFLVRMLYVVIFAVLLVIPIYMLIKKQLTKESTLCDINHKIKGGYCKGDAEESKWVKRYKKTIEKAYFRVRLAIMYYVSFLKTNKVYKILWILAFAFYFNFLTIIVEFFAYYVHFLARIDRNEFFIQIYKLLLDLSTVVKFLPGIIWAILIIILLEYLGHRKGYKTLRHRERMNRGMFNERPIVFGYDGTMGAGKTLMNMSAGLSYQVELRDRAFEVILECDFTFPNFPWIKLERALRNAANYRVIFDLASVRRWVRKKYRKWAKCPKQEFIFDYDYERYGITHNNKLKIENVWETIEDYACAYFVYSVQCSLLISNYSVRSDEILNDLGHFPIWNHDFFKRDARLMESYSRRSHIMDFDMIRFGKKMLKGNPNAHALGFGVYLFTEWDKERKNDSVLRDNKVVATSDEANQKNDLTNTFLKMIRHAVTIRNRKFIVIIYDLQRAEDWGVSGRGIGEVLHNVDKTVMRPVLPFWSPFWWFEMLFTWTFAPFVDLYYSYRHVRSDVSLPIYLMKNITAKMKKIYDNTCNVFNSQRYTLNIEKGNLSGGTIQRYQYISSFKDFSERYGSSCMEAVFERLAEKNKVGIMDLQEYASKMATDDELMMQHSYMQEDFHSDKLLAI